ncbi:MAG: hypothetical protein JSV91_09335 [Phycisphaerales bacterium]|nr:MAG: hypothetical protein JSV91_09335 [Phycisphaerales bacterium]
MKIDSTMLDEFVRLTRRGHELLHICGWDGRKYTAFKPAGLECMKFRAQALSLIRSVFGSDSSYHRYLQKLAEDGNAREKGYHLHEFLQVLEQAYRDIQREEVFESSDELLAALDDDLIEVAEALVNAGFHVPAAQRAGLLLERTIRSLARGRGIADSESRPVDQLNDSLQAMGAYETEDHRHIGACAQIRRDAEGPESHRINAEDVMDMVIWIGRFIRKHES